MSEFAEKIADAVEVALGDDGHCIVYKRLAVVAAIEAARQPQERGEAVAFVGGTEAMLRDRIAALESQLAESEKAREGLREALHWQQPAPVTAELLVDALVVLPAIRQDNGCWWIYGRELEENDVIAWTLDTDKARAALAAEKEQK